MLLNDFFRSSEKNFKKKMKSKTENASEAMPRTIGYVSGTLMCVGMVIGSGIFAVPATILGNVGSVGMTIGIFIIGALVSIFGTLAYCELGCMRPVSGGDKEYLDLAYPKPKGLLPFLFTQSIVRIIVLF
jgi:amino acid transporter